LIYLYYVFVRSYRTLKILLGLPIEHHDCALQIKSLMLFAFYKDVTIGDV
jgi:hypothetical protein